MQRGKLTTKTGDDGSTSIIGGKRLPKDHPIVECIGTIDELYSFLGDVKASLGNTAIAEIINGIQKDLFTIMSTIAGKPLPENFSFGDEGIGVDRIESLIAELEHTLPPLDRFIVPGKSPVSAKLHIARAVCRRAERRLVSLVSLTDETENLVPYMNRLSDLLFLIAESC